MTNIFFDLGFATKKANMLAFLSAITFKQFKPHSKIIISCFALALFLIPSKETNAQCSVNLGQDLTICPGETINLSPSSVTGNCPDECCTREVTNGNACSEGFFNLSGTVPNAPSTTFLYVLQNAQYTECSEDGSATFTGLLISGNEEIEMELLFSNAYLGPLDDPNPDNPCANETWPVDGLVTKYDVTGTLTSNLYGVHNVSANMPSFSGFASTNGTFAHQVWFDVSGSKYYKGDIVFFLSEECQVENISYLWNTGETTESINVSEPGTYSVTITDCEGCTSTDVITISGVEEVIASNSGPIDCQNSSTQLSATGNGSFNWVGPNSFSSTMQNPVVSIPGTYTVEVDIDGCTTPVSATTIVEETPLPNAGSLVATGNASVCSGELATIAAIPTVGKVIPNGFSEIYVLTSGTGLVIEQVNTAPNFEVAAGSYTIHTLVYDPMTLDLGIVQFGQTTGFDVNSLLQQGGGDICGSLDVAGASITVSSITPSITVENNGPLPCENIGGVVTLQVVNAEIGNNYSWTGPNGFSSTMQNPSISTPGTYTVTVTSADGCTNSASTTVTQTPCQIDLELTKSVDQAQVTVGENVVWTISVVNEGPNTATGVSVGDLLPSGLSFINVNTFNGTFNPNNLTWTIGTIAVDQTVTLNITTSVDQVGTFTNMAEIISANETDIDSTPNNMGTAPNEDDEDDAVTVAEEPLGSLGNLVFVDLDEDGIQDTNEPGIPGVLVMLLDANSNMLDQTTTDANGNYLFTDLPAGEYKVKFPIEVTESGTDYTLTKPNAGFNDNLDSDAIAMLDGSGNSMTQIYELDEGENNLSLDAGYVIVPEVLVGSLGDLVFIDLDEDGIQDPNEPGISGVIVMLLDTDGNMIAQTQTDSFGNYLFDELPQGNYKVKFPTEVLVNGTSYELTNPNAGFDDALDSDAIAMTDGSGNAMTQVYNLGAGQHIPTIDAGYILIPEEPELAGLGNFTFQDFNDNGMYDAAFEVPVVGVEVTLYDATDLNTSLGVVFTDQDGFYQFINLDPNLDYVVQFGNVKGFARSSVSTPSSQGVEDKNDADFFTGFTDIIDLDPGEFDPTIDAGYTPFRGIQGAFVLLQGAAQQAFAGTQGSFTTEGNAWKMRTDLLEDGILPTEDPYGTMSQFTHVNNSYGSETIDDSDVLSVSNPYPIVDWVFLDLRSADDPTVTVITRSVLVKKDGQLVDVDGNTNIALDVEYGDYYIAIRHRNHLGVMTAAPYTIGGAEAPVIDFRNPSTQTWGNNAQVYMDANTRALWSGDANSDGQVIFQGSNGDNEEGFFNVLSAPENTESQVNYIYTGYTGADLNLNCETIYQGGANDNDERFFNILLHPENNIGVTNFIIEEKIPK